jgi:uncharacterized membrane protein (UPF0127 family)
MNRPQHFFHALGVLGIACCLTLASFPIFAQERPNFSTTSLNIGIHVIKAEVALSEAQREYGLMFRERLEPNDGMLFLFDSPERVCMWMKNTLIPLSVAFMDENGKIVNIEEMKAQTLDSHCAAKSVTYALEMNSGWFKQKNIKPGTTVDGLPGNR